MKTLIFFLLFSGSIFAAEKPNIVDAIIENAPSSDLELRVMLKKALKKKLSPLQWKKIRFIIGKRQGVGYDLATEWERLDPKPATAKEKQIDSILKIADEFLLAENYDGAFSNYQKIAEIIRPDLKNGDSFLFNFYNSILHFMGQSLFGGGRFKEAWLVYNWIPPTYHRYRRVLFEKMWTSFQMGRMDYAYGAIASQQSSYFSNFVEPEIYLVESFILKKLCKQKELNRVQLKIEQLKKSIESSNMALEWGNIEIETVALSALAKTDLSETKSIENTFVSLNELKIEKAAILEKLQKRWLTDKNEYSKQLDSILGYILVGKKDESEKKEPYILPERSSLLKNGLELWNAGDGEQWSDEIGDYVFVGESQCAPFSSH